nr:hypothetical protein [Oscillochloris trichoides]
MNPASERLRRWATRGAIIFACCTLILGTIFTLVIALAAQSLPTTGLGWVLLFGRTLLLWGGGGLFFGAVLGAYASMIWRPPFD